MRSVWLVAAVLLLGCDGKASSTQPSRAPAAPSPAAKNTSALPFTPISVDGTLESESEAPLVAVTRGSISLAGTIVVKLEDGAPRASDREDGASGTILGPLKAAVSDLGAGSSLRILLSPDVSYGLLFMTLASARSAKIDKFELVVSRDGKSGAMPLELPNHSAASMNVPCDDSDMVRATERILDPERSDRPAPSTSDDAPCPQTEPPAQLILSVTEDATILWSISGLEGTLSEPALRLVPDEAKMVDQPEAVLAKQRAAVRSALADILRRRWVGEKGGPKEIILQCDKTLDATTALRWIAALRHDADGKPLFANVLLAAGFE